MAIKNNIRSIRFSDELMEIINDQVGDNFNQRATSISRCSCLSCACRWCWR